jgi:drug/metabolite transporter (DMT)-like permease
LLAAALLWGGINVIVKHLAIRNLNPLVLSCVLYFFAVVVLIPVSYLLWRAGGVRSTSFWKFRRPGILIGATKAAETLCFISAVSFISATQTTLLTKLNSVWTFLILFVLYRTEVRISNLLGVMLSFLGVYLVLGDGFSSLDSNMISGASLAILGSLGFAIFSVALSKDPGANAPMDVGERFRYTSSFLAMAFLFMLPFGLAFLPDSLPESADLMWLAVAGGVFTSLTYYLYFNALTRISSLLAVVLLSFTVLFTLVLEQVVLGISVLSNSFIAGAILIFSGVLFTKPRDVNDSLDERKDP